MKSDTDYKGYRFSIGNAHAPGGKFFAYGALVSFQVKGEEVGWWKKNMWKKYEANAGGGIWMILAAESWTCWWETCGNNRGKRHDPQATRAISMQARWASGCLDGPAGGPGSTKVCGVSTSAQFWIHAVCMCMCIYIYICVCVYVCIGYILGYSVVYSCYLQIYMLVSLGSSLLIQKLYIYIYIYIYIFIYIYIYIMYLYIYIINIFQPVSCKYINIMVI